MQIKNYSSIKKLSRKTRLDFIFLYFTYIVPFKIFTNLFVYLAALGFSSSMRDLCSLVVACWS